MPNTTGPNHIDLTVTDVERSAKWWEDVMGFTRIHEWQQESFRGCTLVDQSGFALGVMSHAATGSDRFDETRVGLDHLSFGVANRAGLDEWVAHLDRLGATHSGVIEAHFGDTVVIRDPDNVQIELFVFDATNPGLQELLESDPHGAS